MPSLFSHAISSVAIGKIMGRIEGLRLYLLGIFCAVIPDLDVLAFKFGIPYGSLFGHRGISHSFFFAFVLAALLVLIFYRNSKIKLLVFLFLFLCTASHGILDAMTSGGKGIAFFAPFDSERHFLPWRKIKVSPIGIEAFFSEWGWQVMKSEFKWIWLPSLLIISVFGLGQKFVKNSQRP